MNNRVTLTLSLVSVMSILGKAVVVKKLSTNGRDHIARIATTSCLALITSAQWRGWFDVVFGGWVI